MDFLNKIYNGFSLYCHDISMAEQMLRFNFRRCANVGFESIQIMLTDLSMNLKIGWIEFE